MTSNLNNGFVIRLIDNLLDFSKSELLQAIQKNKEFLNDCHTKFEHKSMSIEDFIQKISPTIDEKIIDEIKKNPNLKPIEGEFKLSVDKNTHDVCIAWNFYFIDSQQKYIKTESLFFLKKEHFTEQAYAQIKENLSIFKIESPEI